MSLFNQTSLSVEETIWKMWSRTFIRVDSDVSSSVWRHIHETTRRPIEAMKFSIHRGVNNYLHNDEHF